MVGVASMILLLVIIVLTIHFIRKAKSHKTIRWMSFIFTITLGAIPTTEHLGILNKVQFGFPAEVISFYGRFNISLNLFGYIFNFFFFYWILRLIVKVWRGLTVKKQPINEN
ncbi:hypothetical protein [Bacillus alkalicellulosilyticus]|uniref:hypothetical protein n=1 Tax=Alkalihalobacterium alkalicellulosilyticum TaxID=1912214 RepID=UPI000997DCF0|nr:hypothetical protein [Bacillus alkalicellulosilyticus]